MAEMAMHGTYNAALVTLSIAVAILASFTALNLSGRLLAAAGAAQLISRARSGCAPCTAIPPTS
jgi:NO-binding membrane sensor protein with MHYT domain